MDESIATSGNSSNLVSVPTGLLSSSSFNAFPIALRIRGVREAHPDLFVALKTACTALDAQALFHQYMDTHFGQATKRNGARRFHASYLKVLEDWGFDANGQAGAVLKGWAESRFGLFPTFHKEPLRRFNSPAWLAYVEEKLSSRFHNNDIYEQFDLLYEFCQSLMPRFYTTGKKHLCLYRGTNDMKDMVIEADGGVARLNNLSSFTSIRNIAGQFGDTIIEADVPVVKVLCFSEILPAHTLKGESEYLVIGGDYRVKAAYY